MQRRARINIAILADAEKEDAVEDALDGFVEKVALQQRGVVVVLVEIGCKVAPRLVEELQEIVIERAGAVGSDEPLLLRLALAGGFLLRQRIERGINRAARDLFTGEKIP